MPKKTAKDTNNKSTALVVQEQENPKNNENSILLWASGNIIGESLADVDEVKNRLPVILGKILALCWINEEFQTLFLAEPSACLEKLGVKTPEDVIVSAQTTNTKRPSIIVFEKRQGSNFKLRLFSLSLTLMASK